MTGSVESAPKSRPDGACPALTSWRAERGDHRAVVGAQAQRRDAQLDPGRGRTLRRDLAHPRVRDDAAAEQQPWHAEVGAGRDRLGEQHVDDRLAEARRDIRDRHLVAGVRLASTQRATAVFRPENEKS